MLVKWEALKMEAKKKLLISRKPLSDCTNKAAAATSPSRLTASALSSSFLKSRKKSWVSSDVKLLAGDEANGIAICSAGHMRTEHSEAPYVPCANQLPLAASTTPVLLKRLSDHGTNNNRLKPHSFYSRKKSVSRRKHIDAKVDMSSINTASKVQDNILKKHGYNDRPQASTVPLKKKRNLSTPSSDAYKNGLPQDVVERQRAYFAEIDAFELPEEEVESVLELD